MKQSPIEPDFQIPFYVRILRSNFSKKKKAIVLEFAASVLLSFYQTAKRARLALAGSNISSWTGTQTKTRCLLSTGTGRRRLEGIIFRIIHTVLNSRNYMQTG